MFSARVFASSGRIGMACCRAAQAPVAAMRVRAPLTMPKRFYAAAAGEATVQQRILQVLQSFDKVSDPSKITADASFAKDLGLDSLDVVEAVMAIEEEFGIEIPDKDADAIQSVQDAVAYVSKHAS